MKKLNIAEKEWIKDAIRDYENNLKEIDSVISILLKQKNKFPLVLSQLNKLSDSIEEEMVAFKKRQKIK